MSESSIARWGAIPMARTEEPIVLPKRKRPEDEDDGDDDDDISLVSRSPSPSQDQMDVDGDDHISKYDEYLRKPVQEVITVHTKIKPTNKGFSMLAKMGWTEGQPLGLSGDGRVDPIPFEIKRDSTGLGKTSQDVRMIEETVSQRRGLDSERQTKETEEQRKAREDAVARKAAVQDEISSTLRAFYCSLCDKQFKNVAQYDEHTNSYAHHHKARFKDMQANARLKPQEEIDKRKEKERKREEKELRKIAAANGIRMPKTLSALGGVLATAGPDGAPVVSAASAADLSPSMDVDSNPTPRGVERKGGWASINASDPPSAASSGFKKSGWTNVGPSAPISEPTPLPPTPPPPTSDSRLSTNTAPNFRTGGWTSLDTGTVQPQPPPSTQDPLPFPPSPPPMATWTTPVPQAPPGPTLSPPKPVPSAPRSTFKAPLPPPAQPVRSGWQKFQAKNSKRK